MTLTPTNTSGASVAPPTDHHLRPAVPGFGESMHHDAKTMLTAAVGSLGAAAAARIAAAWAADCLDEALKAMPAVDGFEIGERPSRVGAEIRRHLGKPQGDLLRNRGFEELRLSDLESRVGGRRLRLYWLAVDHECAIKGRLEAIQNLQLRMALDPCNSKVPEWRKNIEQAREHIRELEAENARLGELSAYLEAYVDGAQAGILSRRDEADADAAIAKAMSAAGKVALTPETQAWQCGRLAELLSDPSRIDAAIQAAEEAAAAERAAERAEAARAAAAQRVAHMQKTLAAWNDAVGNVKAAENALLRAQVEFNRARGAPDYAALADSVGSVRLGANGLEPVDAPEPQPSRW